MTLWIEKAEHKDGPDIGTFYTVPPLFTVSYTIKVRSAEFGSDPVAVREMLRRALAGGAGPGGSGGGGGGGNDDDQDDV